MARRWTTEDMPEQHGHTFVVTGANSGLGLETCKALAWSGAHVVMACRNLDKAAEALEGIHEEIEDPSIEIMELDLSSLDSVQHFATELSNKHPVLDGLCNNAGIMAIPRGETVEGIEMQLGTNHFGHFALTGLLLEPLLQADAPRIVNVSSIAHRQGSMNFDDLNWEKSYSKWMAYGRSKLANLLFTYALDRRLRETDSHLVVTAAHPGYAATNLQQVGPQMSGSLLEGVAMKLGNALLAQSQERGALPTLYAATAEDVESGDYIGPDGLMEMRGYPVTVQSNRRSHNEAAQEQLWDVSVEWTGVDYAALA